MIENFEGSKLPKLTLYEIEEKMKKLFSKDIEKQKEILLEAKLMGTDDHLVDYNQCGCYKNILGIKKWEQGWIYFTEKEIVCILRYGILVKPIIIPYKNILTIEKINAVLLPIGLKIKYMDDETGEVKFDEFCFRKREKCLKFLENKRNS